MMFVYAFLLATCWYGVSSQLIDCGITGCYAGQILNTVSEKRIFDALGSVLSKGRQNQKCAIGIGNVAGAKLVSPRWYTHSGMISASAPFDLAAKKSVLLLFTKTNLGFYGTEGVLTYDLEGTDLKVAVMWSIPSSDDADKPNMYNAKVYPTSVAVDKALYQQMKSVAASWSATQFNATKPDMQERSEYGVKLRLHMTAEKESRLTLTVDSKNVDAAVGSHRHVTCENKGIFSGMKCRWECVTVGQCWSPTTCETAADCTAEKADCWCY